MSYLAEASRLFPPPSADGKIPTLRFLEASKGVVGLVEMMGKVFSPVKRDMSHNIDRIEAAFAKDRVHLSSLQDIVEEERAKNGGCGMGDASEALLWLKRGLEFFLEYLALVLAEEARSAAAGEEPSASTQPHIQQAYDATLKRHHGKVARQLFRLISRATPCRRELLTSLNSKTPPTEVQVREIMNDLRSYVRHFTDCMRCLCRYYAEIGWDTLPPAGLLADA